LDARNADCNTNLRVSNPIKNENSYHLAVLFAFLKGINLHLNGFTTGRWFSPGIPISSTNNTDCHDIAEILLKVTLITINQTKNQTTGIFTQSVQFVKTNPRVFYGFNTAQYNLVNI